MYTGVYRGIFDPIIPAHGGFWGSSRWTPGACIAPQAYFLGEKKVGKDSAKRGGPLLAISPQSARVTVFEKTLRFNTGNIAYVSQSVVMVSDETYYIGVLVRAGSGLITF